MDLEQRVDPTSGRSFFVDLVNKTTTWERPAADAASPEVPMGTAVPVDPEVPVGTAVAEIEPAPDAPARAKLVQKLKDMSILLCRFHLQFQRKA